MSSVANMSIEEKVAIVCLYFSRLKSDDERYKGVCHPVLKKLAEKYAMKYSTIKNNMQRFDAQYPDNGRNGWLQKPLEQQHKFLFEVYKKYGFLPEEELVKIKDEILEELNDNKNVCISLKTKDPVTVNAILDKKENIVFDGINILRDSIYIGQLVFIVFGGDKPAWKTGLVGIGVISKLPYDDGYDVAKPKNFKVNVDIKLLLDNPIKREDLVPYKNTYDIIGIGPITKWEPNQALSQVDDKSAIALMRAMLEIQPAIESELEGLIIPEQFRLVKGATVKLVPVEVNFGEDETKAITEKLEVEQEIHIEDCEPYTQEDFLKEVFMKRDEYELLSELLLNKKNIILQGAPGVGKTFMAKRLAYSILGYKDKNRVQMVQFHQSYSYEDFIVGYRPTGNGFELEYGPFYKFCKQAEKDSRPHFFIIDEINRGNVSKIFGELLMLIEADKREESLKLLYTKEEFYVPKNVYIIGMMNTADRSLAIIDYALRRRFAFYDVRPAFNNSMFIEMTERKESESLKRLISYVKLLNDDIRKDDSLGSGFEVGHSYFCTSDDTRIDNKWIKSTVEYEIIPLINEYWFDDREKVDEWSAKLRGVEND